MTNHNRYRHHEVITLLYGDPAANLPSLSIDSLFDYINNSIPLITTCLNTGSAKSQEEAGYFVRSALNRLGIAYDDEYNDENSEEVWSSALESVEHNRFGNQLVYTWALVNLMEEVGTTTSMRDVIFNGYLLREQYPEMHFESQTTIMSSDYWRGVAALTLARNEISGPIVLPEASQVSEFIKWSSTHADIKTVIELATERKTLDCGDLQSILDDRDNTSVVREGFL